jgi:hypothetical protein
MADVRTKPNFYNGSGQLQDVLMYLALKKKEGGITKWQIIPWLKIPLSV